MALIFDIKRFAINDGPGIRTTLFMKGCPLRCVWCHNPEGYSEKADKLYTKKKCIGCGSCIDACPQHNLTLTPDGIVDGGNCTLCGLCADNCPTLALRMAGKEWQMDELMAEVEKERKVMEDSGGGVTICGGEPLMHHEYLLELLTELKRRGLHCTVDTTLLAEEDIVKRVAELTDLFLVDLKMMEPEKHMRYTRVGNRKILSNIRMLSEMGARMWVRIPLIDGINADDQNLQASADFLSSLPNKPEMVNVLIYHDVGKGKHARMGTVYNPDQLPMEPPSEQLQQHALDILRSRGLECKVGG